MVPDQIGRFQTKKRGELAAVVAASPGRRESCAAWQRRFFFFFRTVLLEFGETILGQIDVGFVLACSVRKGVAATCSNLPISLSG